MEIKKVKFKRLIPSDYNPRTMSDEELKKLDESINRFGYIEPIVWNERNGHIISGHQRYKILSKKMKADDDIDVVVVNFNELKEKTANLCLNKVKGEWDYDKLGDLIKKIDSDSIIGFSKQELDELRVDYDFSSVDKEMKELELEEIDFICWTAKLSKKDFKKVKEALDKAKRKLKLGQFTSDDSNGFVLQELCRSYI